MCGLLKALGVRVRRVADLEEGALYLDRSRLLLLDFQMPDEDVKIALDQAFLAACEDVSSDSA